MLPGPGPVGTGWDGTFVLTPVGILNVTVGSSSTGTTVPRFSCSWLGLRAISNFDSIYTLMPRVCIKIYTS